MLQYGDSADFKGAAGGFFDLKGLTLFAHPHCSA
jgi:hypothetical protein